MGPNENNNQPTPTDPQAPTSQQPVTDQQPAAPQAPTNENETTPQVGDPAAQTPDPAAAPAPVDQPVKKAGKSGLVIALLVVVVVAAVASYFLL